MKKYILEAWKSGYRSSRAGEGDTVKSDIGCAAPHNADAKFDNSSDQYERLQSPELPIGARTQSPAADRLSLPTIRADSRPQQVDESPDSPPPSVVHAYGTIAAWQRLSAEPLLFLLHQQQQQQCLVMPAPSPMLPLLTAAETLQLAGPAAHFAAIGPNILRAQVSSVHNKTIPHNEAIDMGGFKRKKPINWTVEDVAMFTIDVARKHQLPTEDVCVLSNGGYEGHTLLHMDRLAFVDRFGHFGTILHDEFCLYAGDEVGFGIAGASSGGEAAVTSSELNLFIPATTTNSRATTSSTPVAADMTSRIPFTFPCSSSASSAAATLTSAPKTTRRAAADNVRAARGVDLEDFASNKEPSVRLTGVNKSASCSQPPLKRNKDGRPRRRSQHGKGNKLWEFIRDALKDSNTCPSVVRWEDRQEGVFRIVESEKLARLWGEKKSNQKMTYEKLSRAMRTYYDKLILVPVPKTGLYPKKLVYKFGPNSHGWDSVSEKSPAAIPGAALDGQFDFEPDADADEMLVDVEDGSEDF